MLVLFLLVPGTLQYEVSVPQNVGNEFRTITLSNNKICLLLVCYCSSLQLTTVLLV
jgi:hypothetical protein